MDLAPFASEQYFARHEFASRHLLSASDCDGSSLHELLSLADEETSALWRPREEESWRFALDDLFRLLRPGATRLVVCSFPRNPTGYLPSPPDFRHLVELTQDPGAVLFSDEMYWGLELPGYAALPSAVELSPTAVVLSGMSKTYGLPGLRLGWPACRHTATLRSCASLKDYTTICAAASSEVLAPAALRGRTRLLAAHRERAARNLQLCRSMAEKAGIMLLPSTVHDYGDSHVHIGLGRVAFPDALAAFDEYLTGNPR